MNQHSSRRSASPISYSTKKPRWAPFDTRSQPREIRYRVVSPVPASLYNSLDPETYAFMIRSEFITETSEHQDEHLSDARTIPIYISSSPIPEEIVHQHEGGTIPTALIYIPSSPVQQSIEFDEPNPPVYLPRGLRLYGDDRDTMQYVPRVTTTYHPFSSLTPSPSPVPPQYTLTHEEMDNNTITPPPAETTHNDSWTPNSATDQPLIWSSEVNVQILSTSPPYHPSTPTPSRTISPTSPSMDFVPVPTYDNPEYESISPRYRTQEDQDRDYFLLETLRDPEIQAMETLEGNSLWRRRWTVDYGSDADDEGEVGGY